MVACCRSSHSLKRRVSSTHCRPDLGLDFTCWGNIRNQTTVVSTLLEFYSTPQSLTYPTTSVGDPFLTTGVCIKGINNALKMARCVNNKRRKCGEKTATFDQTVFKKLRLDGLRNGTDWMNTVVVEKVLLYVWEFQVWSVVKQGGSPPLRPKGGTWTA